MKRREFIGIVGGAIAWPLAARAQQSDRVRRVGVLIGLTADDAEGRARVGAFEQQLTALGWIKDQNVIVEDRWATPGDLDQMQAFARDLVTIGCNVILVNGERALNAARNATSVIPIIIALSYNANNFGPNLARPDGNVTGFLISQVDLSTSTGKSVALLKELAPNIKHIALLISDTNASKSAYEDAIRSAANANSLEPLVISVSSPSEIQPRLRSISNDQQSALIVANDVLLLEQRELVVGLAENLVMPAIYPWHSYVQGGGLIFYGVDPLDFYRSAAIYADRILRGAKPGDLPVQQPTKYELVINLKTAKALGISVPQTLLVAADEVIE